MIIFIAITAALAVLTVVWVIRPLLRSTAGSGVSSERLNASIYRDQLNALDRDLARGLMNVADHEATKDELQLRLLDDVAAPTVVPASSEAGSTHSRTRLAVTLALLLPLASAGMYAWLGSMAAMDPAGAQLAANEKVEQMVDTLADRLKSNPSDTKGWAMLARSYKVMGRMEEAEQAYVKAGDWINTDAEMLVDYADLLAVRANSIDGKALELVHQALKLVPLHPTALMMAGIASYQQADYAGAVAHWEKLLTVLEPDSEEAQQVESSLAEARKNASVSSAAGVTTQDQINQMVQRLADRLKANPDDLEGWSRLARAYKVQGRLEQAENAYEKAIKLVNTDANLLTQYADLLAMRAGNTLEGRPLAILDKALAINPKQPEALMMVASAAYRRADYTLAITRWETVLTVLEPGSRDAVLVSAEIAKARSKLGQ